MGLVKDGLGCARVAVPETVPETEPRKLIPHRVLDKSPDEANGENYRPRSLRPLYRTRGVYVKKAERPKLQKKCSARVSATFDRSNVTDATP
jgi:hypothetical protein